MMIPLLISLCAIGTGQPATHEALNPLYKELRDPGLVVGPNIRTKLPAPTMPDELNGAKQKAIITQLIGADYNYEDFTRDSVVAPYYLKLRDITPSDPSAPARGVDVWFIVYGDFRATEDEKFIERVTSDTRGEGKSQSLTREDLAARKIPFTAEDEKRERYGYVEFDFMERVRLKLAGRAVWSKTPESIVAAAQVDSRFRGDAKFPNEWQSLSKENGIRKLGPPTPYGGAGFYLKITRLSEPVGALFIEQHIVFAEPQGWFDGANLLRSKMPQIVQVNVRKMRSEWKKSSQGK